MARCGSCQHSSRISKRASYYVESLSKPFFAPAGPWHVPIHLSPAIASAKRFPAIASTHVKQHRLLRLTRQQIRSEEHTSELQSRGHLVCRLLLEKKNIT